MYLVILVRYRGGNREVLVAHRVVIVLCHLLAASYIGSRDDFLLAMQLNFEIYLVRVYCFVYGSV